MDLHLGIALWGAAWATVAIIWNLLQDLRARGRLVVSVKPTPPHVPNPELPVGGLRVTITNHGRRPLTIATVYCETRRGARRTLWTDSPHWGEPVELSEGQMWQLERGQSDFCSSADLRAIVVVTSTGKTFRTSRRHIRRLTRQHHWPGSAEQNE
jgi:hypothetical protein